MLRTIERLIQMEKMQEKQFIRRGEKRIYVIDRIDRKNKKIYLISCTDDNSQSAICLGFDEVVYDDKNMDGSSARKAWILEGIKAMPINLDWLLKNIQRK